MLVIIFCKIKTLNKNNCLKHRFSLHLTTCCAHMQNACATDPENSGYYFMKNTTSINPELYLQRLAVRKTALVSGAPNDILLIIRSEY